MQIYAFFLQTFRSMVKISSICKLLQIYAEKINSGSKINEKYQIYAEILSFFQIYALSYTEISNVCEIFQIYALIGQIPLCSYFRYQKTNIHNAIQK